MTPIETERLSLIPVSDRDTDLLHAMWTDPGVRRYLFDDISIDRETAASIVAHNSNDWSERRYGLCVMQLRESGEAIGFVGFRSSADQPEPELVYGLLPQFWGRGYATEGARAMLRYVFEAAGVGEVWAATNPPNSASLRVLERAGFTFERHGALGGIDVVFYRVQRAGAARRVR